MHQARKYLNSLALVVALAAGGFIVAAATPQEASVQLKVYDSGHHDYHNWDSHEDQAYRGYLNDSHQDYRAYDKQSHKNQQNYWNWRHKHPDHD
jgi:hypothetical protein